MGSVGIRTGRVFDDGFGPYEAGEPLRPMVAVPPVSADALAVALAFAQAVFAADSAARAAEEEAEAAEADEAVEERDAKRLRKVAERARRKVEEEVRCVRVRCSGVSDGCRRRVPAAAAACEQRPARRPAPLPTNQPLTALTAARHFPNNPCPLAARTLLWLPGERIHRGPSLRRDGPPTALRGALLRTPFASPARLASCGDCSVVCSAVSLFCFVSRPPFEACV